MLQAVAAVLVPLVAVNFTFPFSYCNLSTLPSPTSHIETSLASKESP